MVDAQVVSRERTAVEAEVDRQGVFPYLIYKHAPEAIDWLGRAFGFTPDEVLSIPDGRVAHAALSLDGQVVMLSSRLEQYVNRAAKPGAYSISRIHVRVDNVDAHYERAVSEGAGIILPLDDQFWGLREYHALDLEGHWWSFFERIRSVPQEEVRKELLRW